MSPLWRGIALLLLAQVARPLGIHGVRALEARKQQTRPGDADGSAVVTTTYGTVSIHYPQAAYRRCLASWQQQCWQNWEGDAIAIKRVCNSSLGRPHLLSHLLLKASDVRQRMMTHLRTHWQLNDIPRLFVPRFTAVGWKLVTPPQDMHERVVEWYESQRYRMIPEDWPALDDVGCNNHYDNDDYLIPHDEAPPVMAMARWIKEQLQEWMGTEADPSWRIFYGARLQRRGGTCALHVDAGETHVMSATYNIAQRRQNKPWPLAFVEPGGHVSKVEQQPGQMVFYEGSSGMHGRPEPLDGEEFVSIYFHFRPKDWHEMYYKALPSRQSFATLVEVREPEQPHFIPSSSISALEEDDSCPADSADTHAAARVEDLWRAARTYPHHTFSPEGLSQADVMQLAAGPSTAEPRALAAASGAVHHLGLWDFVALHAQRTPGPRVPADVTLARWVGYLQPGTTLYVAGDAAGEFAGKGEPLNVTVVTWADVRQDGVERDDVEELICARARIFVGASDASGLTGRVQSLREELGAPTTATLSHQDTLGVPRDDLRPDLVAQDLASWAARRSARRAPRGEVQARQRE